jgi:aspartyl-tRNA(Asn)/glutamyl-tRNA(Gln) amidotransferase subunit C
LARDIPYGYGGVAMVPPQKISRDGVLHIAKLASLSLNDAEADAMARELSRIAEYVDKLGELDLGGVPPTLNLSAESSLRHDEVEACLSHEEALAEAPEAASGGFAVPRFLETGR